MTSIAATFSRPIRMPRADRRTVTRPGYLKRFRYFIETSGWDEMILARTAWLDKICLGILIAPVLCFAPIVIRIFLR